MSKNKYIIQQLIDGNISYDDPRIDIPITDEKLALTCINTIENKLYDSIGVEVCKFYDMLSINLQNNTKVIKVCVEKSSDIYGVLSDEMKENDFIIKQVIKKNNKIFKKLSVEQQHNREYINLITHSQINIMHFKSEVLKDIPTMLYVFNQNVDMINSAPQFLLENEEICRLVVNKSLEKLRLIKNRNVKNDPVIAEMVLKKSPMMIFNLGDGIKNDRDFAIKILKKEPEAYIHLAKFHKYDKEIALLALKKENMFFYLDDEFKNNKEFIQEIILDNIKIEKYIPEQNIDTLFDIDFLEKINTKYNKYVTESRLYPILKTKRRIKELYNKMEECGKDELIRNKPKI